VSSRTHIICGSNVPFKVKERKGERVKDGVNKLKDSLERDAKNAKTRTSNLPKDWNSRVLA